MQQLVLETVQWADLPDIDDVEPLGDSDAAVLREVGDLLRKHGVSERFGVCLLHRHFDVAPGERLVEETDVEARISVLKVQPASVPRGAVIETMWRFGREPLSITECVKECDYNQGHKQKHVKRGR